MKFQIDCFKSKLINLSLITCSRSHTEVHMGNSVHFMFDIGSKSIFSCAHAGTG